MVCVDEGNAGGNGHDPMRVPGVRKLQGFDLFTGDVGQSFGILGLGDIANDAKLFPSQAEDIIAFAPEAFSKGFRDPR